MVSTKRAHRETSWRPGPWGWSLLLAAWTVLPILLLGLLLTRGAMGDVPAWPHLVPFVIYGLAWAGATPFVVTLGRRFPLSARRGAAHVAVHAAASAVAGVVLGGILVTAQLVAWASSLPAPASLWETAQTSRVQVLFTGLLYWIILLVARAVDGHRYLREREILLAEARLAALKAQVRPHFLFNALNAASALIDEDPEAAQEMLARLGELLRASLELDGKAQETALGEEIALLRAYLEIEQARFGNRLDVTLDIAAELHDVLVPQLLLQPLVENAVRYGVSRDSTSGRLTVRATARGDVLELVVEDDGPGVDGSPTDGVGLATTRARLRELYGQAGRFELRRREPRGTVAVVEMPLRRRGAGS